ncbi:hypothetical protein PS1M3_03570 [Pseudoalteromonas sp. PS1M3]|jgi:hypothetical protein|nr:hypothetical protein PS1M3_03570 [Pseudoalteromonas sp. PS1M3]
MAFRQFAIPSLSAGTTNSGLILENGGKPSRPISGLLINTLFALMHFIFRLGLKVKKQHTFTNLAIRKPLITTFRLCNNEMPTGNAI